MSLTRATFQLSMSELKLCALFIMDCKSTNSFIRMYADETLIQETKYMKIEKVWCGRERKEKVVRETRGRNWSPVEWHGSREG